MGKEADAVALWPGAAPERGRLQDEPPKLIFRGAERHVFQGEALFGVSADGRDLILSGGPRFTLPGAAEGWVQAIAHPKSRLDKLDVAAGQRIGVVNLSDPDFERELATRCPPLSEPRELDLLFYGADSAEELVKIGELTPMLKPRAALWIVSLKGKLLRVKDVEVMAAAKACGLVDIKVCAFSETRTALKFVRRRMAS